MNAARASAIAVITASVLGITYGGLEYHRKTDRAGPDLAPTAAYTSHYLEVPLIVGFGAVVAGGLLARSNKRKTTGPQPPAPYQKLSK